MNDYEKNETTRKSEAKCARFLRKMCSKIFDDNRVSVLQSLQSGAKVDMIVLNRQNCKSFVVETKEHFKSPPRYISTKKIYNIRNDYQNNGLIVLIHKNTIYWNDPSKITLSKEHIFDNNGDPCYIFQGNELSTNLDDLDSFIRLKLIVV